MRTSPLLRKLLRDLLGQKSQVLAIALVLACGIATLIMARGTLHTLLDTRSEFYRTQGFAEVFVNLKRAPQRLLAELRNWPAVRSVDHRVQSSARLELPDFSEPVRGLVLSVPERQGSGLNRLYLRAGRWPAAQSDDEVLLTEGFAQAHGLHAGDRFVLRLQGRTQQVRVVGIALSPEFVYQLEAGAAFPDFKRFAVLWMAREPLARALDLDGALNQLSLRLQPGHSSAALLRRLDQLLEPYGGTGAVMRADQTSHKFLSVQFDQLGVLTTMLPSVFLAVAAFLLHVVLSRLIGAQREQIALLRAFGYTRGQIVRLYGGWVAAIVVLAAALGCVLGWLLGEQLTALYRNFYRFPKLDYVFDWQIAALAIGCGLLAASLGAGQSLREVMRLAPAQAMRPPAPLKFRHAVLETLLPAALRSLKLRMLLRHLERHPWRTLLGISGIALACAVLMISVFQNDAFTRMVDQQFGLAQRNDLAVYFYEPRARSSLYALERIPGVRRVEPIRAQAVWFRNPLTGVSKRSRIEGFAADSTLKRLLGSELLLPIPQHGLILTTDLARRLGVAVGDAVDVEALDGRRAHFQVRLAGTVPEPIGQQGVMRLEALNRLLGDGHAVNGAMLDIDARQQATIYERLEDFAQIASIGSRSVSIQNFYDTLAKALLTFTWIATVLAAIIAFGVLYNSARVMLTERSRELATLRVLGYTPAETASVLTAELWTLTLCALPAGLLAGLALCHVLVATMTNDLMRVPAWITGATFAAALSVVLLAAWAAVSDLRRRVRLLDPVHALKVRE
jgi:putative ABC transport system permease protein